MSTCPTKDILQVYLDDELPEVFVKELKSHVDACPECQKYMAEVKLLRSAIKQHSASLSPDPHFVDQSFERLQTKLNYTKHAGRTIRGRWPVQNFAGVAAAAAVFALVVPFGLRMARPVSSNVSQVITPLPISAANVSQVSSNKGVVLSGSISPEFVTATNVSSQTSNFTRSGKNLMKDVDVLRPNFDNGSTISIKITMPGMDTDSVTTVVQLPLASVMGLFE